MTDNQSLPGGAEEAREGQPPIPPAPAPATPPSGPPNEPAAQHSIPPCAPSPADPAANPYAALHTPPSAGPGAPPYIQPYQPPPGRAAPQPPPSYPPQAAPYPPPYPYPAAPPVGAPPAAASIPPGRRRLRVLLLAGIGVLLLVAAAALALYLTSPAVSVRRDPARYLSDALDTTWARLGAAADPLRVLRESAVELEFEFEPDPWSSDSLRATVLRDPEAGILQGEFALDDGDDAYEATLYVDPETVALGLPSLDGEPEFLIAGRDTLPDEMDDLVGEVRWIWPNMPSYSYYQLRELNNLARFARMLEDGESWQPYLEEAAALLGELYGAGDVIYVGESEAQVGGKTVTLYEVSQRFFRSELGDFADGMLDIVAEAFQEIAVAMGEDRADAAQMVRYIRQYLRITPSAVTIDYAIDADGVIRRVEFQRFRFTLNRETARLSLQLEMLGAANPLDDLSVSVTARSDYEVSFGLTNRVRSDSQGYSQQTLFAYEDYWDSLQVGLEIDWNPRAAGGENLDVEFYVIDDWGYEGVNLRGRLAVDGQEIALRDAYLNEDAAVSLRIAPLREPITVLEFDGANSASLFDRDILAELDPFGWGSARGEIEGGDSAAGDTQDAPVAVPMAVDALAMVIFRDEPHSYWDSVEQVCEREMIDLEVYLAGGDLTLAREQLEAIQAVGVADGVLLAGFTDAELESLDLLDYGLPIALLDNESGAHPDAGRVTYVTYDREEASRLLAEMMLGEMYGSADVVIAFVEDEDDLFVQIMRGIGMEVLTITDAGAASDEWTESVMEEYLVAYGERIAGVYAGTASPEPILRAARTAGMEGEFVLVADRLENHEAIELLREGAPIHFVACYPLHTAAEYAVLSFYGVESLTLPRGVRLRTDADGAQTLTLSPLLVPYDYPADSDALWENQ